MIDFALDVMRRVAEITLTSSPEPKNLNEWRFGINGTPFVRPEGKCPYCLKAIRSNAIWFITEDRLVGQLPICNFPRLSVPEHPHADSRGRLCLGTAETPQQMLFFGINPGDRANRELNVRDWLSGWLDRKSVV